MIYFLNSLSYSTTTMQLMKEPLDQPNYAIKNSTQRNKFFLHIFTVQSVIRCIKTLI